MTAFAPGRIDRMDFTPAWWYRSRIKIVSEDECAFFELEWPNTITGRGATRHQLAARYMEKLRVYHDRFQNHMPVALRKQLLKEIQEGKWGTG